MTQPSEVDDTITPRDRGEIGEPKKVEVSPEQNKKSEKWESGRANNGLKNDDDLWRARTEFTMNLRHST